MLTPEEAEDLLFRSLQTLVEGERVLVLIPDHTRTAPLPTLFPALIRALHRAARVEVMVALGTHPPLSEERLLALLGLTREQRERRYRRIPIRNHAWDHPASLVRIGALPQEQMKEIAGEVWHSSLGNDVPVRLNRAAVEADRIIIVGPVFPHEVAGFSGGAKYLFPGISGPEMIDVSHWLGALTGIPRTIGTADTPVRRMIEAAAALVPTPVTLVALVMSDGDLAGLFAGGCRDAWEKAANISRELHIKWLDAPLTRAISCAPPRYDELWTAAKAMYKLEPAMSTGGEIVVYAPHLETVSASHGRSIAEVGYHVLPYFLDQWDRFAHVPRAVLAHSTHLRGSGTFSQGIERPNLDVKLATRIPPDECARLNLGYVDPSSLDLDRPEPDAMVVRKAGETLFRVRGS